METIGVEPGSCRFRRVPAASSHEAPEADTEPLLFFSSNSCCPVEQAVSGAGYVLGSCRAPSWLSVTVTRQLEVVIRVRPGLASSDTFARWLVTCPGANTHRSHRHLVRLKCINSPQASSALPRGGALPQPLCHKDVVSADVSARSACTPALAARGGRHRSGEACRDTSRSDAAHSSPKWCPLHREAAPHRSTPGELGDPTTGTCLTDKETVIEVAGQLPTIALLVRCRWQTQQSRCALLVVRPTIAWNTTKWALVYDVSAVPVSESARHVSIDSCGNMVLVLSDTFVQASLSNGRLPDGLAAENSATAEATVVLRGSCVPLGVVDRAPDIEMRPLLLHLGLHDVSATPKVLHALMRCRVGRVCCRPCFSSTAGRMVGAGDTSEATTSQEEVVLYTTAAHTLVFRRVSLDGGEWQRECGGTEEELNVGVVYTCTYGARLNSEAHGRPPSSATVTASARGEMPAGFMIVAPPWQYEHLWRHSVWFSAAMAARNTTSTSLMGDPSLDASWKSSQGQQRRRHTHALAILSMSHNRRVWLLGAGRRLCVVTVPSGGSAAGRHAQFVPVVSRAVHLDASLVLHDTQYIAPGGHAGFLLLCRHHDIISSAVKGLASASGGGSAASAMGSRFVHVAPSCPLRLFFLSLFAVGLFNTDVPASVSLLPLPVLPTSPACLSSLPKSFLLPSSRLGFTCTAAVQEAVAMDASAAETVYISIGSSGGDEWEWTATARVPPVWSWCASLQERMKGLEGSAAELSNSSLSLRRRCTHVLSALLPHNFLASDGTDHLLDFHSTRHCTDAVGGCCITQGQSCAVEQAASSSVSRLATSETWTEERVMEAALLELDYPYRYSGVGEMHRMFRDDAIECAHRASRYLTSTLVFLEGLHALLRACLTVTDNNEGDVAGVTAVFAGFTDALQMSGLLTDNWGGDGMHRSAGWVCETATRVPFIVFLHGCTQHLRHALEDVASSGNLSALMACTSHLMDTVRRSAPSTLPDTATPQVGTVWRLLLQPLFDLTWVLVQASGVFAEFSGEMIEYCSPAVRAMVGSRGLWCLQPACTPETAVEAEQPEGRLPHSTAAPDERVKFSTAAATAEVTVPLEVPGLSSFAPKTSAVPPVGAYTSAELYEVVRRVFLVQGAAAALGLLRELQRHDSTKGAIAEMAELYEAMQQRLQQVMP